MKTDGTLKVKRSLSCGCLVLEDYSVYWCDTHGAAQELLAACEAVAYRANMQIDADNPNEHFNIELQRGVVEDIFMSIAKAKGG